MYVANNATWFPGVNDSNYNPFSILMLIFIDDGIIFRFKGKKHTKDLAVFSVASSADDCRRSLRELQLGVREMLPRGVSISE